MKLIKKIQNLLILGILLFGGFNCAAEDATSTSDTNIASKTATVKTPILVDPSPVDCLGPRIINDFELRLCDSDQECSYVGKEQCGIGYSINNKHLDLWRKIQAQQAQGLRETLSACPCTLELKPTFDFVKCNDHQCTAMYKPMPVIKFK